LALEEAGWRLGFYLAMVLTCVQAVHFIRRESSLTAFTVQVRVAYLGLLIVGLWEALHFIHWLQLVGTSARVLVGYCLLARSLSLLPWNRVEPISLELLWRTFFAAQGERGCSGRYACGSS
jgi:hypothetical protein